LEWHPGPWSAHHAAVDPRLGYNRNEIGGCRGELDVLAAAYAPESPADEAVPEYPEHVILELVVEVDQDVAAKDEVRLTEHPVADQVVVGEGNACLQRLVHLYELVSRMVIVRQRAGTTALLVIARVEFCLPGGKDAVLGPRQRHVVEVGGVDVAAVIKPRLLEEDRQ